MVHEWHSNPRWRLHLGRSWAQVLRVESAAGPDAAGRSKEGPDTVGSAHGAGERGARGLVPGAHRWVRPQAVSAAKLGCAKRGGRRAQHASSGAPQHMLASAEQHARSRCGRISWAISRRTGWGACSSQPIA